MSDPPNTGFLTLSNEWPWVTLSLVSLQAPQGHLQLNPVYTGVTRGSESQAHTAPTHRRQVQSGPRAPRASPRSVWGLQSPSSPTRNTLLLLGAESECEGADRSGHCPGHWGHGWTGAQGLQYRKTMVCPQGAWLPGGREQTLVLQGLGVPFGGLPGQMAIYLPWRGQHGDRSGAAQQTLQWPH